MRANEIISELFRIDPKIDPNKKEHVNSWEWRYTNKDFAQALFKVGDVVYMFNATHDTDDGDTGDWSVEFQSMNKVDGISGFGETGTGNEVEVFKTVIDIIRTLLAEPDKKDRILSLHFSAATPRRKSLYPRIAQRQLPNWKLEKYGDHFVLTKPTPVPT